MLQKGFTLKWESLPQLTQLARAQNLQFTCIDANEDFLAIGTKQGIVLSCRRAALGENVKQTTIDKTEISKLKFSSSKGSLLAVASGASLYLTDARANTLIRLTEHLDSVTAIVWSEKGVIFSGDRTGVILQSRVSSFGTSETKGTNELFQADSAVVQLQLSFDVLLCSSLTRVYVFDLTKPGVPLQVGKNLRQGAYGVCFEPDSKNSPPALLSSRPGRRIWRAHSVNASVLATLKFKLPAPRNFAQNGFSISYTENKIPKYVEKSLQYSLLLPFQQGVVSYREKGRNLFFLDTTNVNIFEWYLDLPMIYSLAPTDTDCFVLHSKDSSITVDDGLVVSTIRVEEVKEMIGIHLRSEVLNQHDLGQCIGNSVRYSLEDDNLFLKLDEKLNTYKKTVTQTEQGEEITYEGFEPKSLGKFLKVTNGIKQRLQEQKAKEEEEKLLLASAYELRDKMVFADKQIQTLKQQNEAITERLTQLSEEKKTSDLQLQKMIQDLKQERDLLNSQKEENIRERGTKVAALESEIKAKEASIEFHVNELKELKKKWETREQDLLKRLEESVTSQKDRLAANEQHLQTLQKLVESKDELVARLTTEQQTNTKELKSIKVLMESLKLENRKNKEFLETSDNSLKENNNKLNELEREKKKIENESKRLKEEIDEIKLEKEEMNNKNRELEESIEKLRTENQDHINVRTGLEQRKQKLETELSETDASRKEAVEGSQKLAEQLRDALTSVKQKEHELTILKEDVNTKNNSSQRELAALREQLNLIKTEFNTCKSEKESQEQEWKTWKEGQDKKQQDLEKQVLDLQNENHTLLSEKKEEQLQKEKIEETFTNVTKEYEEYKKQSESKESEFTKKIHAHQDKEMEYEKSIEDLTAENKSLTNAKEELKSQYEKLSKLSNLDHPQSTPKKEVEVDSAETLAKLNDLKQQVELKQHMLESLRKTKLVIERDIEKKVKDWQTEKNDLLSQIEKGQKKGNKYKEQITRLEGTIKELERAKLDKEKESEEEKRKRVDIEQDIKHLKTENESLNSLKGSLRSQISIVTLQASQDAARVVELSQQVLDSQEKLTEATSSVLTMSSTVNSLEAKLEAKNSELKETEKKFKEVNATLTEEKEKVKAELQGEKEAHKLTKKEIDRQGRDKEKKITQLNESKKELQTKISTLESNEIELQREIDLLKSQLNEKQNQINKAVESQRSVERELNVKIEQLQNERETLIAAKDEAEQIAKRLGTQIDLKAVETESIRSEKDSINLTLQHTVAQVNELKLDLERVTGQLENFTKLAQEREIQIRKVSEDKRLKENELEQKIIEVRALADSKIASVIEESSTVKKDLENQIVQLQTEKQALNVELTNYKDTQQQFEGRLSEITKEQSVLQEKNAHLRTLEETIKNQETTLQRLETQIRITEEKNRELSNQLHLLEEEKKSIEQQFLQNSNEIKILLQKELEQLDVKKNLEDNIITLNQQNKQKDTTYKDLELELRRQIDELNRNNNDSNNEILKLKGNIKNLELSIQGYEATNSKLTKKQDEAIKQAKEKIEKQLEEAFEKRIQERLRELVETEAKFRRKVAELNQQSEMASKTNAELATNIQELKIDRDDLMATKNTLYKMVEEQAAELDELRGLSQVGEAKKIAIKLDEANKEIDKAEREIKILTREKEKLEKQLERKKNPSLAEKEIARLKEVNELLVDALGEKAKEIYTYVDVQAKLKNQSQLSPSGLPEF